VLFYYYVILSRKKGFKEKMLQRTKEIIEKEIA